MGREADLTRMDRKYITDLLWTCSEAPINTDFPAQARYRIGAHHWIEKWMGPKLGWMSYCKHCMELRKFPRSYPDALKSSGYKTGKEIIDAK